MCPENCSFNTPELGRRITHSGQYWFVIDNIAPYVGAKKHLLFVLNRHCTEIAELLAPEWLELRELTAWASRRYSQGGNFVMRMGTFEETGSTVAHLHAHWILRDTAPGAPTVYAHFGPTRFPPK